MTNKPTPAQRALARSLMDLGISPKEAVFFAHDEKVRGILLPIDRKIEEGMRAWEDEVLNGCE